MKKSYLLAVVIALAAVGWVLSGEYGIGVTGDQQETQQAVSVADRLENEDGATRLTGVRVAQSRAQDYVKDVVVRGRTEALRRVVVRGEIKGKIAEIVAEKGARVKKGDILVRLEVNERQARLEEAKALARQRQLEFDAAERLRNKGFRAETQFAASAAQLDAANANVKQVQIQIQQTIIRAPFAGIVDTRPVELGDYVEAGTAIAEIVDQDPFLVMAQVSENDVGKLSVGAVGFADLVTGETVEGTIRYLGVTADDQTRTFKVELEVANPGGTLRDGITAELRFPLDRIKAHKVSPAVLTLDDDGRIGIRAVNAEHVVRFYQVRIVGSVADGVWLTGLPNTVEMIVVGQEFVRAGDKVRVTDIVSAEVQS